MNQNHRKISKYRNPNPNLAIGWGFCDYRDKHELEQSISAVGPIELDTKGLVTGAENLIKSAGSQLPTV
jgi:hypothetical protein